MYGNAAQPHKPIVYYLLGGGNEQYAVWYGSRENGLNKFWAVEYNVGNNITYEPDETGAWQKSYNIYDHLGSLRSKLRPDGTIIDKVATATKLYQRQHNDERKDAN